MGQPSQVDPLQGLKGGSHPMDGGWYGLCPTIHTMGVLHCLGLAPPSDPTDQIKKKLLAYQEATCIHSIQMLPASQNCRIMQEASVDDQMDAIMCVCVCVCVCLQSYSFRGSLCDQTQEGQTRKEVGKAEGMSFVRGYVIMCMSCY